MGTISSWDPSSKVSLSWVVPLTKQPGLKQSGVDITTLQDAAKNAFIYLVKEIPFQETQ